MGTASATAGVTVSLSSSYTRQERDAIAQALRNDRADCPRCKTALKIDEVHPSDRVSYVRHRVIAVCPRCHRSAAVDVPRD